MKRVPIAEFKARLSQYVEEAGQDDIVITKHGRPVARLVAECEPVRDAWAFYASLEGKYPPPPDDLSTGRAWDTHTSHQSGQNF